MRPKTILFCGIPNSLKTTICQWLKTTTYFQNWIHIDSNDVRKTINKDLGFSDKDRMKNLINVAYICNIINKEGFNILLSFVAPKESYRQKMKNIISKYADFYIVYLDCSLEIAIQRDILKKVYYKSLNFEFEKPKEALILNTDYPNFYFYYSQIIKYIEKK